MGSGSGRFVCAALASAALVACSTSTAAAQSPTLTAPGFHDSVGVGTHPTYATTAYGHWDQVVAAFRELGATHMRSGFYVSGDAGFNARHHGDLRALAAAGVKLHLILGEDCALGGPLERCLEAVKTSLPPGSVDFLEWPNEADRGAGWAAPLQAWGRELSTKVRADPVLSAIPVVGPALPGYGSPAILGDQSAFVDRGSIQPYTGARSPDPLHIAAEKLRMSAVSGNKRLHATEAGYHTSPLATNEDQPPADEPTAAIYTLRTLLEHYADGIERTYLYELADEGTDPTISDVNYGLLRSDFSPKPAFTAVKNLLQVVGTTGPAAVIPLLYRIADRTSSLRELVLQQTTRTYLVVLWRTDSVWDRDARRPLVVAPRTYGVEIPGLAGYASADPVGGPGFLPGSPAGDRITQSVGADPVVLQITIQPGGQPPGFGVAGGGGSGPGSGDRTRPKISKVKIKKIARRRWAVYFRLSEPATVGTRMDRGRKGLKKRFRLLRRIAVKRMPAGDRRRIAVGNLKVGRHRVLLAARDAAGNRSNVLVAFKIRAAKKHSRRR